MLCACYRSPSAPSTFWDELHDILNFLVSEFPQSPLFLLGDFNFPKIRWTSLSTFVVGTSAKIQSFLNLCLNFNLTQLVSGPTRAGTTSYNTLDLILVTEPNLIHSLTCFPGLSDHCFLHFFVTGPVRCEKNNAKFIRDYASGDYTAINNELAVFIDDCIPEYFSRTVEENWNLFKNKATSLVAKYVPLRRLSGNKRCPWFSTTLKRLPNKKKRLFRLAKRSRTSTRWNDYSNALHAYRTVLKGAKDVFLIPIFPHFFLQIHQNFGVLFK